MIFYLTLILKQLKELLFSLCTARGVSGTEHAAAGIAGEYLGKYAQVEEDINGNLFGVLGDLDASFHILLDAHLDQIGLIVTGIDSKGFLKAEPCGGIDRRVLQGSPFIVLGKEEVPCVCGCMPPHLSDGGEDKPIAADALWFDTGPSFFTVHTMSPPSISLTVRAISPSSSKMRAPGHPSCGSSL